MDILKPILDAASQAATGLAGLILPTFKGVFMETSGDSLNAFGVACASFAGLAIAFGIFKWMTGLIRRRG